MRVLVLFSTFDGQTEAIARRVAANLAAAGHVIRVLPVGSRLAGEEIAAHDAVVMGGAIRYGRFSQALLAIARSRAEELGSRPNAFFCVSLSARPGGNPAEVARYFEDFAARTGWQPNERASFAGALPYTRYNPFIRFMMRLISRATGGDTDASRDYEYTDWSAVDRFAERFAGSLETTVAAVA
jgi:menaquinone-dependent protoporphyrinogen oxidase